MGNEAALSAATTSTPRVAIVDIDRRIQSALADVLRVAGLDVVGSAGDMSAALELAARGAQVFVVDPRLPDLATGMALVNTLGRDWPSVRVVIMGWGDGGETPMSRSAAAFISKSATPEQFVAAAITACRLNDVGTAATL